MKAKTDTPEHTRRRRTLADLAVDKFEHENLRSTSTLFSLPRLSDSEKAAKMTPSKIAFARREETNFLFLPPPYKSQWRQIETRRAKRDFIYGRDEEHVFSEQDSKIKTPCCGLLCFHIIEFLNLIVNTQSFSNSVPVSYYCFVSIGSIKRCTKIIHSWDPVQIKMNTVMHFPIDVSEWREAPGNRMRIEIWSFQDPETHFIVGTTEIHIYNFIRLQHMIDYAKLYSDGMKVGTVAFEAAFSYGTFGYGQSNQLKNFSQPIMETISHSMFPRVKLSEDGVDKNCDNAFQSRKPEVLKMFTYHSLILEMDDKSVASGLFGRFGHMGKGHHRIDVEPKPIIVQHVDFHQGFPVHCKLHMNIWQQIMQPDFNDMFGEYVCLGHKRERLEYLTNMVQGRMRDIYEEEASPIFEYIKSNELETIHQKGHNPRELSYPKTVPCPTSEPFTLGKSDEEFQDGFPPVKREPGFLSTLFGYEKKPSPTEYLNDMDYPAYKSAQGPATKPQVGKTICLWLIAKMVQLKMFLIRCFYYIFPDGRQHLHIPEISLTRSTPEGSTSNIYTYFTRESRAANSKIEKLMKQSTLLIEMTTKKWKRKKVVSESSSSDDEDDADEEAQRKPKKSFFRKGWLGK